MPRKKKLGGKKKVAPKKKVAAKKTTQRAPKKTARNSPAKRVAKKKTTAKRTTKRAAKPVEITREVSGAEGREVERVVKQRELTIRGFWDRYPSADQRRHRDRYKHIPKQRRKGKTAFDILQDDYLSFTPSQRKRLRLKVTYGVAHDSGTLLTDRAIRKAHLIVDLVPKKALALASLSSFLVRAGLVDTPSEWRINKNADETENALPLGIEWVLVEQPKPKRKSAKSSSRKR